MKTLVGEACESCGWGVELERIIGCSNGSRAIADVFASKDGRDIVFEIQLSAQGKGKYLERHQKYAGVGIECFWLSSRSVPLSIPHVKLVGEDNLLANSKKRFNVLEFVGGVLHGKLKYSGRRWNFDTDDKYEQRYEVIADYARKRDAEIKELSTDRKPIIEIVKEKYVPNQLNDVYLDFSNEMKSTELQFCRNTELSHYRREESRRKRAGVPRDCFYMCSELPIIEALGL